jgi:uncharacterized protein (DUF2236 family)
MRELLRGFPWKPPPGRPGDPGLYGPGSAAWRVNREVALMLGGPRALLLQIAHPAVAAGVAEHSDFPANAFERLWRTLDAMLSVSFGDREQARRAAGAVTGVHRRVRGAGYTAMDPALLLWVHATLVDTALEVHARFVRQLSFEERAGYYLDMTRQAELFGVPAEALPAGVREFDAYVRDAVAALEVGEEARRLAPAIVRPPVPAGLRPLAAFQAAVTVELLPPRLRDAFGLRSTPAGARAVRAAQRISRAGLPLLPSTLRRWPHARAAERRAASRAPEGR